MALKCIVVIEVTEIRVGTRLGHSLIYIAHFYNESAFLVTMSRILKRTFSLEYQTTYVFQLVINRKIRCRTQ